MVFLILLLAFLLRLANLNQSLWLDEAVQAVVAQRSIAFAFEELKGDFHPPFFHLLMHFWVRIFGTSEIFLRLPSVILGAGTVLIALLIARKIGEGLKEKKSWQKPDLIVGLLMATAPYHIYYSQEARMYSAGAFFAAGSFYFFLKLIDLQKEKNRERNRGGKGSILAYLLFSTLAFYTDYYFIFLFLFQGIAIIYNNRPLIKYWVMEFLLATPLLPLLASQIRTGIAATRVLPRWAGLVNVNFLKALPLTLVKFSLGRISFFDKKTYLLVALALGLIYGGLITFWIIKTLFARKSTNSETGQKLVFGWLTVPIILAWLVSLVVPNYQPFRLLLTLPAFYLLLVFSIYKVKNHLVQGLLVFMILTINLLSLTVYYSNPYFQREDWRGVANFLKKERINLAISAQAFNWPLTYYQVEDQRVESAPGAGIVSNELEARFLKKVESQERLSYTSYLADLYDPANLVPEWLSKAGFAKIKEVSFNQIPVWVYQRDNQR